MVLIEEQLEKDLMDHDPDGMEWPDPALSLMRAKISHESWRRIVSWDTHSRNVSDTGTFLTGAVLHIKNVSEDWLLKSPVIDSIQQDFDLVPLTEEQTIVGPFCSLQAGRFFRSVVPGLPISTPANVAEANP